MTSDSEDNSDNVDLHNDDMIFHLFIDAMQYQGLTDADYEEEPLTVKQQLDLETYLAYRGRKLVQNSISALQWLSEVAS